jgi:hypothetical protein
MMQLLELSLYYTKHVFCSEILKPPRLCGSAICARYSYLYHKFQFGVEDEYFLTLCIMGLCCYRLLDIRLQGINNVIFIGTSLKVVGSIPDEVIGFFNWPNSSNCIMTLGSTQPLTEMSTRNLPGSKRQPACEADNLIAICELTV